MATPNNKTSLLVSEQLPSFVREEHDTFVKFLEYYYEAMEQEGQPLYLSKNIPHYLDIDQLNEHILYSHDQGNDYFAYQDLMQRMYDTFIAYIPDSILADRTLLLKHAKEFYRSTGSEKSARFLIQALFNKEATFYYPKVDVLRASDGKWFIERSLKVTGVQLNNTSNSIAVTNFANTTIKGISSGATAIVEKVDTYFDKGQIIYELKLSSINKEFQNAEKIYTYFTQEGTDYFLSASLFSGTIINTTLVSGGSGYVEGTTIPIISSLGTGGQVIVSSVTKGSVQAAGVVKSGAGFKVNDPLVFAGSGSGAAGIVASVDTTQFYHPNSYNVVWTTINLVANNVLGNVNNNVYETMAYSNLAAIYTNTSNLAVNTGSGASVTLINLSFWSSNSNVYFESYDSINVGNTIVTITSSNLLSNVITVTPGLPGNLVSNTLQIIKRANVYTTIANAVSYFAYSNCGPAYSLAITNGGTNYTSVNVSISANATISKMGILGRMEIINGGIGYLVNDRIEFLNGYGSTGSGAIANVTSVAANGMITGVKFQQMPGHIIGGQGYDWNRLPSANVVSGTGTGANIAVTALIGHNELITQSLSNVGTIQSLSVISGGSGYTDNPKLNFTGLGDGQANAGLVVVTGAYSYPGRYITDDGHISAYNFLEDRDYYQEFSYVVRVDETTNKYRAALKDLIHPAGTKMYGEYTVTYDSANSVNSNLEVTYANTGNILNAYKSTYQVQGYTPGVFNPNVVVGVANAEFVVGSYKVNTSNHLSVYDANSNIITIQYYTHGFIANDYVYLHFGGDANAWANLANANYIVTSANQNYFSVYNPNILYPRSNTGNVKVWNPDVTVYMPYSRPSVNDNVYLQFQTTDPSLSNGFYTVYATPGVNTFNVMHNSMITANDAANVANLITKKIIVTANNHEYVVGEQAYILFNGGDTANNKNGYYTVTSVGSNNKFNIAGQNLIFSGTNSQTYQKRSYITITNHPHANGNTAYISFVSGDQGNTTNGVYTPIKINANQFTFNVAKPATANCNVRVWYKPNNYTNVVFTTGRTTNGFAATNNVYVEFYTSASDLANGIYMVRSVYSSNTYNIYYNANTYIQNSWTTYHSLVTIPGNPNTINTIGYSGAGVVANTRMEGTALVSLYK
jgi:hypothetical protein